VDRFESREEEMNHNMLAENYEQDWENQHKAELMEGLNKVDRKED
jgi:hypothetical protein